MLRIFCNYIPLNSEVYIHLLYNAFKLNKLKKSSLWYDRFPRILVPLLKTFHILPFVTPWKDTHKLCKISVHKWWTSITVVHHFVQYPDTWSYLFEKRCTSMSTIEMSRTLYHTQEGQEWDKLHFYISESTPKFTHLVKMMRRVLLSILKRDLSWHRMKCHSLGEKPFFLNLCESPDFSL